MNRVESSIRREEPVFHRSVVAWVVNLCPFLRLSQAKALAAISWGAMKCRRVSQADLGRAMETDTVAKHNIKRVSRFVLNSRVNMAEGCHGLVALAAKAAGRGFARAELAGKLGELGMDHVIRVNAKVRFVSDRFDDLLS